MTKNRCEEYPLSDVKGFGRHRHEPRFLNTVLVYPRCPYPGRVVHRVQFTECLQPKEGNSVRNVFTTPRDLGGSHDC